MDVTLTADEVISAASVGVFRRTMSMFGRRKPQHYRSPTNDEWSTEVESACAELAVAKALRKYWSGLESVPGKASRYDVGVLNVRHSAYPTGHCILYPEDNDEDTIVLVTGRSPSFRLSGWIRALDGKSPEFWKKDARCPSYWVPQDRLRPIVLREPMATMVVEREFRAEE